MAPSIILTRGLPGSGKTTWAKALVDDFPTQYVRANRDELRAMLFPAAEYDFDYKKEAFVTTVQRNIAAEALKAGKNVIADDTHLRRKYITAWQDFGNEHGARVEVKTFDVPLDECLRRNKQRGEDGGRFVPVRVIEDFAKKYLPFETVATLQPEPVEQYPSQPHLPPVVIVDIDGTVALMNGRSPYDWSKVGEDAPNQAVVRLVQDLLNASERVIFLSGRDGSCYDDTLAWLKRHFGDRYVDTGWPVSSRFTLLMRDAGDNRKDTVVKREIFDTWIRGSYDVRFVLDDRDSVVAMWRSLGLTCLQVATGAF